MSHVWQIVLGCVLKSPEVHMCTPPPSGALLWKHLQALPYVKTPRGLGLAYRILWSSRFSRMRSKSSLLVTYTPCFLCLFLWQERLFLLFFFNIYVFFMWTIFKVFIEFVTVLFLLFIIFWIFGLKACGILAPQPGIEPAHPVLEGEIIITAREVPRLVPKCINYIWHTYSISTRLGAGVGICAWQNTFLTMTHRKLVTFGNSLVVQWLRLWHNSPARGLGSIPGQGTKILQAACWGGKKKKERKVVYTLSSHLPCLENLSPSFMEAAQVCGFASKAWLSLIPFPVVLNRHLSRVFALCLFAQLFSHWTLSFLSKDGFALIFIVIPCLLPVLSERKLN